MFAKGSELFLLIPEAKERILYQGRVTELTKDAVTARFADPIRPRAASNVFLQFEVNKKFMQQAARVQALLEGEPKPLIAFARIGQALSAESRMCYRVSVAAANYRVTLNGHDSCLLQDISATGLGVISAQQYLMGDTVEVTLSHDGCFYTGQARVHSAQTRLDGTRLGLHAVEQDPGQPRNALHDGLSQMANAIQRQQLRHLARA